MDQVGPIRVEDTDDAVREEEIALDEEDVEERNMDMDAGQVASSSVAPGESTSNSRKRSAWVDPDDSTLQISLADTKQARKLRDDAADDVVTGSRYESKLRREFERIQPAPEWANQAKSKAKAKRRRSSNNDEDDEIMDKLLSNANGIIEQNEKGPGIQKGILSIERLRDANLSAKAQGQVKALQFHPSAQVPLLFTASSDRRLRLFNVSCIILTHMTG